MSDYDDSMDIDYEKEDRKQDLIGKVGIAVVIVALAAIPVTAIWAVIKGGKTADKVKDEIIGKVIGIEKTVPYDARLHLDTDNNPKTAELIHVIKSPDEIAKMDVMIGDTIVIRPDGSMSMVTRLANPKPDKKGRFNVETTGLYNPDYFDAGIKTGQKDGGPSNSGTAHYGAVFSRAVH